MIAVTILIVLVVKGSNYAHITLAVAACALKATPTCHYPSNKHAGMHAHFYQPAMVL